MNYSIFVIVSNVLIFGFGIAYYKKKIPSSFYNVFEKVRIFEISKRVTIISLVVILVVYIGLSTPELFVDESTQWQDYRILEIVDSKPFPKSRKCPYEAFTQYPSPRKDSILEHFAGDSTITNGLDMSLLITLN